MVNDGFDSPEKMFSIIFSKALKNLIKFYYNVDNSCLFLNEKEIYKFKADNKNNTLPT